MSATSRNNKERQRVKLTGCTIDRAVWQITKKTAAERGVSASRLVEDILRAALNLPAFKKEDPSA